MIKKVLLPIILLMILNNSNLIAQEKKSVLRVGAGVQIHVGLKLPEYKLSNASFLVWPTLFNEYQYNFTKYWGLGASLAISGGKIGIKQDYFRVDYAVTPVFTPFPNRFRWVKLSCGIGAHYSLYLGEHNTIDNKYDREEYTSMVVAPSIRIYFLDNKRFELALLGVLSYDYYPSLNELFYHYQIGLLWGVKF